MKALQTKTLTLIFGILLVFSIAGCMPGGGRPPVQKLNIHEGTKGLAMEFMEKSPPDEVFLGDTFPLIIEMHNQGSYDITDGVIVVGIEKAYLSGPSEYVDELIDFSLTGRASYDPIGGIYRKIIPLSATRLDPQAETLTTNIAVTTCYPYVTEATAQMCIDTDIFGQREEEKVCRSSPISMGTIQKGGQELPKGQGAPIAITRVEPKMLPHNTSAELVVPSFMIYVKNMGNGLPVDIGVYGDACTPTGVPTRAWNVVGARVYLSDRSSSSQLDCRPKLDPSRADKSGHIKLEKDEDFIRCTLTEGIPKARGTYTTPLMIELEYGYTFTISKSVLIRRQV
jgi:hypothetical protein